VRWMLAVLNNLRKLDWVNMNLNIWSYLIILMLQILLMINDKKNKIIFALIFVALFCITFDYFLELSALKKAIYSG